MRIALCIALLLTAPPAFASEVTPYHVNSVASGVFLITHTDPLGLANHGNATFIVSGEDVILVDTQFTRRRTQGVLEVVKNEAHKPVATLINTHWHDDHTFGNQVIRKAYPNVEIIAHTLTKRDMAGIGVTNREQQVAGAPGALDMFRTCVKTKKTMAGREMSADELNAYESTIRIVEEYLAEIPQFELTLPTRTFDDRLELKSGQRTIEVLHLGPAVTDGDAVVWLPAERVLIAGDIVDNPLPFAYRSNIPGWIAALEKIRELNPRIIVPGHGEVLHGTEQVVRLAALLTSIRDQTHAAVKRGASLDDTRAAVDVTAWRGAMVGDNPMLGFLFDDFFLGPAVQSAHAGASAK